MPEMDGITALKEIKKVDPQGKSDYVFSNGTTSNGN